jgi:predicted small metal-binding protein
MTKSYACVDVGVDCPGAFTTENEAELFQLIELHARESHPDFEMTPELWDTVKAAVKTV